MAQDIVQHAADALRFLGRFVPPLAIIADLVVPLLGWIDAIRTEDPAQEHAAQLELLRAARLRVRAEVASETRAAIAASPPVFLNEPFEDEDPWPAK